MVFYRANPESPVFSELRGLMVKTAGLADVLADALEPIAAKLRVAFVYGSIASGSEQTDSDIDLVIVGNVSPPDLAVPLRRARDLLGRQINPSVYTPAEFVKKRARRDHFLTRVLVKPKLFVLGNNDDLERAAS